MSEFPPDLGKYVTPGFINADPPGQPLFALAGSSGLATSIGQAGSEVSVNGIGNIDILSINDLTLTSNNDVPFASATIGLINDGSIVVTTGTTTGTEPMTLTAQGIITIQSEEVATGGINITTAGGGAVVNIVNAGEFDFDPLGLGALTGVQTINGAVYPPAGTAITSITQAGALVACLGNGGVMISSIGAGVTADMMNAGTITFDTLGSGALVNLSTINGAAYPPPIGSISSITRGGGYVEVDASGSILAQAFGNAFLAMIDSTSVAPNRVTLATGQLTAQIKMDTDTIRLDNLIATQPSQINMDASGAIQIYATDLLLPGVISGISTINGTPWPVPAYVLPADITVSTLTAADYVSTLALNVSSIANVAGALNVYANDIVVIAPNVSVVDPGGAGMTVLGGVTQLVNVSTINAAAYPPIMSSAITVSTITAAELVSTTALNVSSISGVSWPVPGYVLPADITVSTITAADLVSTTALNVSSISGIAWPLPTVKQATYYKSAAQNLTNGTTEVTFDLSGSWNSTGGYITHTDGTKDFTVVQAGLYQLEFNASINGSGVAWTGTKSVAIDITRSPTAEQAIITQAASINSGTSYGQGVSATYYLVAGDVINLQIFNQFSSGTPTAFGLLNTFDLNTFFTWRFIS